MHGISGGTFQPSISEQGVGLLISEASKRMFKNNWFLTRMEKVACLQHGSSAGLVCKSCSVQPFLSCLIKKNNNILIAGTSADSL